MKGHILGFLAVFVAFLWIGCSASQNTTLDSVNPVRTYSSSVETLFDAARTFCRKEEYIIDRAEAESGSFLGHKVINIAAYSGASPAGGGERRTIIMHLKAKRLGGGKTELTANFAYGQGHISTTRDEERLLVENYSMLFRSLDAGVQE